jgi:protein-S-isoprenylcysteine O-methyltransferase Ste14
VIGLLLAPVAPILELLGWLTPLPLLAPQAADVLGVAAICIGFALTAISQIQMGPSWRIGVSPSERTCLVTNGIFGYLRNPIFAGMLIVLAGVVLLVPSAAASLAVVSTFAGLELQVRFVEEPYLLRTHGDAYLEYASSVGRFAPFLGRLR